MEPIYFSVENSRLQTFINRNLEAEFGTERTYAGPLITFPIVFVLTAYR